MFLIGLLAIVALFALSGCDNDPVVVNAGEANADEENAGDAIADESGQSSKSATDDPKVDPRMSMPEEYRDPKREHKRQVVASGKPQDLTFDDLKFDIEVGDPFERELLSAEIEALDGKQITLGGFIRPSYKQDGLKSFIFVRDNKECCFGPQAAIYDCVLVKLKKGTTTSWSVRPVRVSGTFYLKEYELDGLILAIFRMKDAKVVN